MDIINRLERIKSLQEEANGLAPSNKYDDIGRIQDILSELFQEDIDWLIGQAERVEEVEKQRSEWKGVANKRKTTIKTLNGKLQGAYTHVNRTENQNVSLSKVLERFREENIKLRQALNDIKKVDERDYQDDIVMIFDIADKALEETK